MASFCSNCGVPAAGAFCVQCGNPIQARNPVAQRPALAPAPAAKAGGGSALKIILIVVGGLFLVGVLAAGSLLYFGYRAKQKITQLANEYGLDAGSGAKSGSNAAVFRVPSTPPAGSGCPLLPWQEASQSLAVAFERVESKRNADGTETCDFFVGSEERQRLAKAQMAAGFRRTQNPDEKQAAKGVESVAEGWISLAQNSGVLERAIGSGFHDSGAKNPGKGANPDPFLHLELRRVGGQSGWSALETGQAGVKSALGGVGMQPLEGVGDKAYILPGGLGIFVLKGDAFFALTFTHLPGADKASAVTRQVVAHL